jgi:hypothetical protein
MCVRNAPTVIPVPREKCRMNVARDIAATRARRAIGQSAPGSRNTSSMTARIRSSWVAVHSAVSASRPFDLRSTIASSAVQRAERMAAVPGPSFCASCRMIALSIRTFSFASPDSAKDTRKGSGRLRKSMAPAPGPNE